MNDLNEANKESDLKQLSTPKGGALEVGKMMANMHGIAEEALADIESTLPKEEWERAEKLSRPFWSHSRSLTYGPTTEAKNRFQIHVRAILDYPEVMLNKDMAEVSPPRRGEDFVLQEPVVEALEAARDYLAHHPKNKSGRYRLVVTSGFRSAKATKKQGGGEKITKAAPGESTHNSGNAAYFVIQDIYSPPPGYVSMLSSAEIRKYETLKKNLKTTLFQKTSMLLKMFSLPNS